MSMKAALLIALLASGLGLLQPGSLQPDLLRPGPRQTASQQVETQHLRSQQTSHWTSVHGHQLYYQIGGSGRPLLMLHGGGSAIDDSFAKQLDSFAREHTLIAPEQVGQGHSPEVAGALSYSAMMEDTAALLNQLHLAHVDVVGWSDGGILALMLAIHHPELVGHIVISGANIDPHGLLDSDIEQMRNAENASASAQGGMENKLRRLWLYSPTAAELSPALLKQIHNPVLVLAGDRDVIKLDHTLAIYQALPSAQLSILPNTGHATFSEKSELVNPLVLSFLAQPFLAQPSLAQR